MGKYISYFEDCCVDSSKAGQLGQLSGRLEWNSLNDLARLLIKHHSVPSVFTNDYRCNDNFIEAYCLFFDFDSGKNSFKTVHQQLIDLGNGEPVSHLIMASKNHLKDKNDGKGAIERFHVYIELEEPIVLIEYYKYYWQQLRDMLKWELDESCKTPTKYAFKHPRLLAGCAGSHCCKAPLDLFASSFLLKKQFEENRIQKQKNIKNNSFNTEVFTKSHKSLIEKLSTPGERHNAICELAGIIKKLGFGKDECRIIIDNHHVGDKKHAYKTLNSFFK